MRKALEWLGHFGAVQTILQTEFARNLVWPAVYAVLTGTAGILGGLPLMWVLMAASVAFAATVHSLLKADEYRERRDPLNKLRLAGWNIEHDLLPTDRGNPGARRLNTVKFSVEIHNEASFPISFIVENADSEIEGRHPPRKKFPEPPILVLPGSGVTYVDDPAIDMGGMECDGELKNGRIDFRFRYGLPGKERYDFHVQGRVECTFARNGRLTKQWLNYQ